MNLNQLLLTKEDILNKIPEESLWEFYFQSTISLNKKYLNPLRNDNDPDCTFIYGDKELIFKDWAKDKVYNIFLFIQEKYHLNFQESLQKIANDFNIIKDSSFSLLESFSVIEQKPKLKKHNYLKDIKAIPTAINQKHIDYWSTIDYNFNNFKEFNIYPIKKYVLIFESYNKIINTDFSFLYKWENNKQIYSPYAKSQYKFRHKISNLVIGLDKLKTNNYLVITKSYKDWVVLQLANINSIAILSESYKIDSSTYMQLLKYNLYTLFDNDDTGLKSSKKYEELYNTKSLFYENVKDSYDYYKLYGLNKLKTYLNFKII